MICGNFARVRLLVEMVTGAVFESVSLLDAIAETVCLI